MNNKKIFGFTTIPTFLVSILGFTPSALANSPVIGSITPSLDEEITITKSISIDRIVTLPEDPVTKVDVLFLADNTGSMGWAIDSVQDNATSLLNNLTATYDDIEIGVARYYGDPEETMGWYKSGGSWTYDSGKVGADRAYQLQEPVSGGTKDNAIAAINQWSANGGADWPEANFFALHQAATSGAAINGHSTGSNTGWRDDAKKIIVWFGDALSHTSTLEKQEVINALNSNGIAVIAISTVNPTWVSWGYHGIDGPDNDQASDIASATRGIYADGYNTNLATQMETLIGEITTNLDLVLTTSGDTSGLDISFTCTDSQGCDDVGGGESRTFRMDITGNQIGTYQFKTIVPGTDLESNDKVIVNPFKD